MKKSDLSQLILLLPKYDPHAQAGDCWFDQDSAWDAIEFIHGVIRFAKGKNAGKPFHLEPWQIAIVANLFGWKHPNGRLRYREAFVYVGKKNGKTALMAAMMLLMLATNPPLGAELYSAASSQKQAGILFEHAVGMVRQSDRLKDMLTVYGEKGGSQQKSITYPDAMSAYKCLAADADTVDGVEPYLAVIDELHRHKNTNLADVLQKGTGAQAESLVVYTSTADYNRPSACNSLLRRARDVQDNGGDPSRPGFDLAFLPAIYEADKDDDWELPETWRKANPNMGVTVTEEFLARECRKAKENSADLNNFLRLNLNIVTDAVQAWLDMDQWDACDGLEEGESPAAWRERMRKELAGQVCFVGIDLSQKRDFTAAVYVFPPTEFRKKWVLFPRLFIPKETAMRREKTDRVPIAAWVRDGFIEVTEGRVVDYEYLKAAVYADAKWAEVKEVAYDPYAATQIAVQLSGEGMTCVEFRQGYLSMSEPAKEIDKLIAEGKIEHGGNPVMRWMAGNTVIRFDPAGNIKPDKEKSTQRIDGIVAGIMALGRALVVPVTPEFTGELRTV